MGFTNTFIKILLFFLAALLVAILAQRYAKFSIVNYLRQAFSGIFSLDNRFVLWDGYDLLKRNLLLPVAVYITMFPWLITSYLQMHRVTGTPGTASLSSFSEWREIIRGYISGLDLLRSFTTLTGSLATLDYIFATLALSPIPLIAVLIFCLSRPIGRMNQGGYKITPERRKVYNVIVIASAILGFIYLILVILQVTNPDFVEHLIRNGNLSPIFWIATSIMSLYGVFVYPFITCVILTLLIYRVTKMNLDKQNFWQTVIDSYMSFLVIMLVFWGLDNISALGLRFPVWAARAITGGLASDSSFIYPVYFTGTVGMFLNFFFLPFPIIVVMHKLGFRDAIGKLKSWHEKYPERIGGFIFSAWIISFSLEWVLDFLRYLLRQNFSYFWGQIISSEVHHISKILLSSWLLLCLIRLVKELHEMDTGTGDEQDYIPAADADSSSGP